MRSHIARAHAEGVSEHSAVAHTACTVRVVKFSHCDQVMGPQLATMASNSWSDATCACAEKPLAGHRSKFTHHEFSDVKRHHDRLGPSTKVKGECLVLTRLSAQGDLMREQRCLAQEVLKISC